MMPALLTLFGIAGVIAVIAFVLLPLRQHKPLCAQGQEQELVEKETRRASGNATNVTALLEAREAALEGLAELDFDRNLGNLSEEDYLSLRSQYRAQAIEVLKALDVRAPQRPGVGTAIVQPGLHSVDIDGTAPPRVLPSVPHDVGDLGGRRDTPRVAVRRQAAQEPREPGAGRLSRRSSLIVGGAMALALVAAALWVAWLRGPASSVASAENTRSLGVMHSHAAFLVPGSRIALVAHHNGLLRSTDDGQSWAAVPGISGDSTALATGVPTSSVIFLASGDKVMVTRDAGLTWEEASVPSPAGQITALGAGDGKSALLYAAVAGNGLYSTADLRTWQTVGSDLGSQVDALVFRTGPVAALYAASPGDGVLASGDGGRTWGSSNGVLNAVLPSMAVRTLALDASSGDQFTAADGTRLVGAMYAGTDVGLFKTIDAGSSWSPMPLREPISVVSARSGSAPLILAIDSRSRVWRSTDKGNSWSATP